MITTRNILHCNQILAAMLIYVMMLDPIRDIASRFSSHTVEYRDRLISLALASDSSQVHDYYGILGVKKDATKQEIHRAFRQLAKKYHPDKNKDKSATDEFIKIFKAYETLSDEKKRTEYDKHTNDRSNSWSTMGPSGAYDFDINEFFKQYEDHFHRHAQQHQHPPQNHQYYHNNHHHHHHQSMHERMHQDQFKFHGINLDELFHDIDEDEFNSFGRWFDNSNHDHTHYHEQTFDGHFGDGASFFGSHFSPDIHDSLHHYQQQQSHQFHHGGYQSSCQTIKRQVNGVIMTQTSCS